jgi:hypothetical protein
MSQHSLSVRDVKCPLLSLKSPCASTIMHAPVAGAPPELGPLADLCGTWVGKGFNLIALPDKHKPFVLKLNATKETMTFTSIGAPIRNRGSVQDDIWFRGLHYTQQVNDALTNRQLHLEPGLLLHLPASVDPDQGNAEQGSTIVRLATIPHANSFVAQGPAIRPVKGGPRIDPVDATPFTIDPRTGNRTNVMDSEFLRPFNSTPLPPGIPSGAITNPNETLCQAVEHQDIVKTQMLTVSARPIGGINGTSVAPPTQPNNVGGILNIPFLATNAAANSLAANYWIETVMNRDGTRLLQLQYSQTVILDFFGLNWPHITVATLVKQ